ncbi:MAG: nodulation protein NfeD [bacterium]
MKRAFVRRPRHKRAGTVRRILLLALLAAGAWRLWGSSAGHSADRFVLVTDIRSTINPGISNFVGKTIEEAAREGAACIILQMDTPGGLDTAMRDIVQDELNSPVPVVVYVAPSGARAASAGVLITLASHIAAMAPGTNIGAAHPVGLGGGQTDETMLKKVENDAAAYARSLAEQRGRNADWAVKAVRESDSISAEKALELKVIDLIAPDLTDLIRRIDGREVKTVAGVQKLELKDLPIRKKEMNWRFRLLDTLSNPNIAYILMVLGFYGLFFELSSPGVIFPGVFGAICLILAFFALQTLPVNYAGVLLILLAILLFIAEIKVTSYGVLTLGGIVAMVLGSLMLFESPEPYLRVSWYIILPTVATTAAFFVFALSFALKAQMAKPTTGQEGLIGMHGRVVVPLRPEGKVFVHGEFWNAHSEEEIDKDEAVEVVGVSDLMLRVRRLSRKAS